MSKQDALLKMLSGNTSFTVEEIIADTDLKKSSVINYVKYYLKKLGYSVIIEEKLGQASYRINKDE